MHNLEAVLDLPQEAMYLALGDYLAQRVGGVGVGALSPIERTLWLVREFHWAVREGGLLGYMVLPSGRHAGDAQLALRTIGAVHTANVLRDAIAAYESHAPAFPDGSGLLDEVEDLPVLLCEYARAHREALLVAGLEQ